MESISKHLVKPARTLWADDIKSDEDFLMSFDEDDKAWLSELNKIVLKDRNGYSYEMYPIAQKVYEAHKKNGTLDALMASYTGTRIKTVSKSEEHAAFMQVTQDAAQSAHGSTTGNSEGSSTTATSQAPTDGKSTRRTEARSPAEHSPTLSAADKEKLRMARINANYEHDKKLLAKEDPAFVRSPFHNIGHAQGNEDLSERDLYKIARELNEEKKEKLRNGK